jgi:hypothetical protein
MVLWAAAVPYLLVAWVRPALRAPVPRPAETPAGERAWAPIRRLGLGAIDGGFLALATVTLLSTAYAAVVLGEGAHAGGADELVKLGLYWIAFRTAWFVGAQAHARRLALAAILVAGVLAALVGLAQYFDWLGVAAHTGHWWAEPHHLRGLERDGRVFGTVGNPNYFGALMAVLTLSALFSRAVWRQTASPWGWSAIAMVVLGPLGVVLSGSRGALGLLVAGVVVSGAVTLALRPARLPATLALVALAVAGSVALVEVFPRGREAYLTRLAGAFSLTGDNAVALRLERWRGALGHDRGEDASDVGGAHNYVENGDLEQHDGDGAAGFRSIPGTIYRVAPEAARFGANGIAYRGNRDPGRRAAVYQQRAFNRAGGTPVTASLWVNFPRPVLGQVFLYTNVFYGDGERQDPHAEVAADPTLVGVWQQLSVTIRPDAERRVDFLGIYLLSDDFAGEVYADGFALVDGSDVVAFPELSEAGGAQTSLDVGTLLRRSPVFGGGPGEPAGGATLDNEYLLVAVRYGIVGLLAYLALWATVAATGLRAARRGNGVAVGLVGIVAGLLVFNLIAGSLYQLQLMAVFWPLAGLVLARGGAAPSLKYRSGHT